MSRDKRYVKLIQSAAWRKLRAKKLAECPLCQRCKEAGRLVPATEVHHTLPVETARSASQMQQLMFSYANLESLCHDCHAEAHRRLMSHSGQEARKRRETGARAFADRYLK